MRAVPVKKSIVHQLVAQQINYPELINNLQLHLNLQPERQKIFHKKCYFKDLHCRHYG